ncbi:MAG: hypothetical protein K8L99_35345 [Anaerolineae bacterium]|nr:hypothetical protein [Anaerolineae bacterium]
MKRAIQMLGALALAAGFFLAAPAAHAADEGPYGNVTCTDFPTQTGGWPTDNSHYKTCFNYNNQRALSIKSVLNGLRSNVKTALVNADVNVYYFANRTQANDFFAANPAYSNGGWGVFKSNNARCGQTGHYSWTNPLPPFQLNHKIAIAIYDDCTFASGQVDNDFLQKVAYHEAGHAFAYALAVQFDKTNGPDVSPGYRAVTLYDKSEMASIATCTLFSSYTPSDYEIDLGASTAPVCTGGFVNPGYDTMDNDDIADEKAPYFVNQSGNLRYGELWAEQFSILAGGVGGPGDFFDLTDNIIKQNRMDCSMFVVRAYWFTNQPPGPNNPLVGYRTWPSGCSTTPSESDLK